MKRSHNVHLESERDKAVPVTVAFILAPSVYKAEQFAGQSTIQLVGLFVNSTLHGG